MRKNVGRGVGKGEGVRVFAEKFRGRSEGGGGG